MIPDSIKGKIFVILTLVNLGLASYFAAISFYDQSVVSGITTLLCLVVWITEVLSDQEGK